MPGARGPSRGQGERDVPPVSLLLVLGEKAVEADGQKWPVRRTGIKGP